MNEVTIHRSYGEVDVSDQEVFVSKPSSLIVLGFISKCDHSSIMEYQVQRSRPIKKPTAPCLLLYVNFKRDFFCKHSNVCVIPFRLH